MTDGSEGDNAMVGEGQPRLRSRGDGYRDGGGGAMGGHHGEARRGEAGNGGVLGNRDRNWDIKDT